jgi:hypothetical protein
MVMAGIEMRKARPGDFLRIDDRSGFCVYASETRKEWNGAIVDRRSYEARHPQDFVRARVDRQRVPDPRPRPTDVFVEITNPYDP